MSCYLEATNGPNDMGYDQHAFYEMIVVVLGAEGFVVTTRSGRITATSAMKGGRSSELNKGRLYSSAEAATAAMDKKAKEMCEKKGYHHAIPGVTAPVKVERSGGSSKPSKQSVSTSTSPKIEPVYDDTPWVKPQDDPRYVYLEATNGPNGMGYDQHAFYEMTVIAFDMSDSAFSVMTRNGRITATSHTHGGRSSQLNNVFTSEESAIAAMNRKAQELIQNKGYRFGTLGLTAPIKVQRNKPATPTKPAEPNPYARSFKKERKSRG